MPGIMLKLKPEIEALRLREAPRDGKRIGEIRIDDVIEALEAADVVQGKLGAADQWVQVKKADGTTGYCAAWLVVVDQVVTQPQPQPTPGAKGLPLRPTVSALRIRAQPVSGEQVRLIGTGDVVISLEDEAATKSKLGVKDQWLKVRTIDEADGYAAAWMLQLHDGPIPQPMPIPSALNLTGMNLDVLHPLGAPDPARLAGMGWVRLGFNVSAGTGSEDLNAAFQRYDPHIEKYTRAGLKVMLVFTHQTYGEGKNEYWPWPEMTTEKWKRLTSRLAPMVGQIAARYKGKVAAYQIWNEMDAHIGAVASVPMRPVDYAYVMTELIKAIKKVDPSALCISGGHTGGPVKGGEYARATLRAMHDGIKPDGLAFHPYGRGVTQPKEPYAIFGHIDDEMNSYLPILPGKPVWITEWGILDRPGDKPDDVLKYATELVQYMKQRWAGKVASLIWYAWAMSMHNGYGLVGQNDQPLQPFNDGFRKL
jgi:hypothetical protein